MSTIAEIKNRAVAVKNETIPGANTASRIGGILEDIATEVGKKKDADGGKVLSDNNYTNADKSKVSNLPNDTNEALGEIAGKVEKKADLIDGKVPLYQLPAVSSYAGRCWDESNGTPIGEPYGSIDFLRALPDILGLGCYLVSEDRKRRKLHPSDHYKFVDGTEAALDGTMGDYMWCWNAHYYSCWSEGGKYHEVVSMSPISGRECYYIPAGGVSALGAGVVDNATNKLVSVVSDDTRYRGGTNDATRDNTYKTDCGKVRTNLNSAKFGELARAKGEGWEAGWYVHTAVESYLTRIILGTRHIQAAYNAVKDSNGLYQCGLGAGVTGAGSWWSEKFNYHPFVPTSVAIELGDGVGVASYEVKDADDVTLSTVSVPVFFGLKNFYGHIGRIERGIIIEKQADGSGKCYVAPSMYAPFGYTNLNGLVYAATLPRNEPAGWKYITELSMRFLCHKPTVANGSSTTYYSDGLYNDNATSGFRCPFVRGIADHGAYAGCECLNADSGVANAYAYWSSPLCYLAEDVSTMPIAI